MLINKRPSLALITLILVAIIFSACSRTSQTNELKLLDKPISKQTLLLGTVISIKLYNEVDDDIFNKVFKRIGEIESKMTINGDNSEVIEINRNAGKNFVKVSDDTFYVIEKGKYFSHLSNGRFDISIGPLVKLWNIGTENAKVPTQEEINNKINLVNYNNVILDENNKSVKLDKKDMIIDLGGIAKGYAADEAVRILKENNIHRGIINLGGNIYAYGSKDEGTPWKIGIQNPYSPRGDYVGIIQVVDKTIVTSGVYERFFEEKGEKYHHILDPETGYPVENTLVGISIIADSSIDADSLSTSVFAMGLEEGRKLVENLDNVDAIFVTKDYKVYTSSGIKDDFNITNKEFQLVK